MLLLFIKTKFIKNKFFLKISIKRNFSFPGFARKGKFFLSFKKNKIIFLLIGIEYLFFYKLLNKFFNKGEKFKFKQIKKSGN